ncbi:MAG: ABC transporter permease [Cyclobacteriaceae bacterium]
MLKTHLKFFSRVFLKDKFFSILNISGLALGIAVSIVLLLILQNDLSYDKHHVNHERIYRLGGHLQATGLDVRLARVARELGPILQEEFPEVQAVVRANSWDRLMVKYQSKSGEEKAFYEEDVVRTDSNYFHVFSHEFIAGDPKTCLQDLNTLVITESAARKYFGDEPALDQSLLIGTDAYKVTGVIRDAPANTHLKFDFLLSQLPRRGWTQEEGGQVKSEAFWNPDVFTYLYLPENYDSQDFYDKFPQIFDKYFKSFGDKVGGKYTPILEPLAKIHFYSDLDADEPHGNIAYLYAFTGIGIFIILLACINYMNLSTAKSVNRAAEIAMKKTLGSGKRSLILSFLGESVFLSMISLVFAIALVFIVLKATPFNALIGKDLTPDFIRNPVLLFGSVAIALGIGLISGLYPAFYLPSIPTIKALKGSYKNRKSSHILRKVLTTVQFAISIFVVVCTLFMQDQIDYVRRKELGFDKANMLLLPIQDTLVQRQINGIKNEFLQNPRILAATTSHSVMGMNVGGNAVMWAEAETGMKQQSFTLMFVGEDYLKTMNIGLLHGRDFRPGTKTDIEDVFIANEAAVKLMGWEKEPVGKKVKFFHAEKDGQVIGVVKDFNFASLHNPVEPLLIIKAREEGGYLHLKVQGENLPETMSFIKEKWAGFDPNHPYEAFFLDERFNEQYRADEIQYTLLSGLSGICIFISLLGLLGLSAFTATQRTKEIGIRKVHGATISSIIFMLYKDVMYLIIIAALLIIPLANYLISGWKENFAYRTPLNYNLFAAVAVLALVFGFLTVAFHSLKTAHTNPVESLKYE